LIAWSQSGGLAKPINAWSESGGLAKSINAGSQSARRIQQ
jgi:hypothetical protein